MTLQWIKSTDVGMEQVYALRRAVFEQEVGMPALAEHDARDDTALHLTGRDTKGILLCAARMREEAPAHYRIERLAVFYAVRGTGVGKKMIAAMEAKAHSLGAKKLTAEVRKQELSFFTSCGFVQLGDPVSHDGAQWVSMVHTL